MVTNYPHSIATHSELRRSDGETRESLGSRAMGVLQRWYCGLHGHDTMLHFEQERMALRCASCGHETPGWNLNEVPPTITVRGDVRRHNMARPQLISQRQIA
jgi:hypothetical protein